MRTIPILAAVVASIALAGVPQATADAPSPQHVEDVILAPSPAVTATRAVYANTGVDYINGIEAYVIHLNAGLTQFRVVGDEDPIGGCDIDVYFYDQNRGAEPWTNNAVCTEEGAIPAEATTIIIHLSAGASVGFTFDAWHPDSPPA